MRIEDDGSIGTDIDEQLKLGSSNTNSEALYVSQNNMKYLGAVGLMR